MGEVAIVLESVIARLGPDRPEDANIGVILMDGLCSSLSYEGRETTPPLAGSDKDEPDDLACHILRVDKALFQSTRNSNQSTLGDPSLTVSSLCEGHKWVLPAGRLLRSNRISPILTILYSEWLHQLTCLRIVLVGTENFKELVLKLNNRARQGTRPAKDIFEACRIGDLRQPKR